MSGIDELKLLPSVKIQFWEFRLLSPVHINGILRERKRGCAFKIEGEIVEKQSFKMLSNNQKLFHGKILTLFAINLYKRILTLHPMQELFKLFFRLY